jgi:hypothetical protein
MKPTTDQEQVLQEIPGYVRKDMISRWIRYNRQLVYDDIGDKWCEGFRCCLQNLEHDMKHGILNNDKDMREC